MGKVIPLGGITRLNIPVDRILDGAKERLDDAVIMGWDKNGNLYFASSIANGAEVLWLLEKCKLVLLENFEETNGAA